MMKELLPLMVMHQMMKSLSTLLGKLLAQEKG
jgi:hypothetical protein